MVDPDPDPPDSVARSPSQALGDGVRVEGASGHAPAICASAHPPYKPPVNISMLSWAIALAASFVLWYVLYRAIRLILF